MTDMALSQVLFMLDVPAVAWLRCTGPPRVRGGALIAPRVGARGVRTSIGARETGA